MEGAYVSRRKGIPTAAFGIAFNDSRNQNYEEGGFVDLKYEHTFSNQLNVMARLYSGYSHARGNYILQTLDGDDMIETVYKDSGLGQIWGGELKLTKHLFDRHTLTLGGAYQDNFRQHQKSYSESPYLFNFDDQRTSRIWALYLQDEFVILKNLIFSGHQEQRDRKNPDQLAQTPGQAQSQFSSHKGQQNLIKGLEVSASVYNLFNKKYGDPGSPEHVQDLLMQDGRNYRLKVAYRS